MLYRPCKLLKFQYLEFLTHASRNHHKMTTEHLRNFVSHYPFLSLAQVLVPCRDWALSHIVVAAECMNLLLLRIRLPGSTENAISRRTFFREPTDSSAARTHQHVLCPYRVRHGKWAKIAALAVCFAVSTTRIVNRKFCLKFSPLSLRISAFILLASV